MMRSTIVLLSVVLLGCSNASEPLTIEPASVSSVAPAVTRPEAATSSTAAAREVGAVDAEESGAELEDETDVEAVVLALHARVMGELFARDERIDGPEARLPLARGLTTDPLLQRIEDGILRRASSGDRVVSGGYESSVQRVEVRDSAATVLDCSRDGGVLLDVDGGVLAERDTFWKVRRVEYLRENGRWKVADIVSGGDERCEPLS